MKHKGFFITIEGIDGCGKTVLSEKIKNYLSEKEYQFLVTKEPGGTSFGKHLREILQTQPDPLSTKTEFLLFAADRAHHFQTLVLPSLEQGKVVISDRCGDSSIAYQGYGRGLDCSMIQTVNRWTMEDIEPDLTLYIKIDVHTAFNRVSKSRDSLTAFEKQALHFWQKVSDGFDSLFEHRDNVIIIDGSLDEQTVFQKALKKIIEVIG